MAAKVDAPTPGQGSASGLASMAKPLLMAVVLLAGVALAEGCGLADLLSEEWIDARIRGQGLHGWLLYVSLAGLAVSLAAPRQAVSFLGGYAFGFLGGSLLALAATGLGCALDFWLARWAGRAWVLQRMGQKMAALEQILRHDPLGMALLIRLLPVGSNFLTNLLAGISGVRFRPFLAGSMLGFVPQTLIFALLGSGVHVAPAWRTGLAMLLLIASAWMGCLLYRRSALARELGARPG